MNNLNKEQKLMIRKVLLFVAAAFQFIFATVNLVNFFRWSSFDCLMACLNNVVVGLVFIIIEFSFEAYDKKLANKCDTNKIEQKEETKESE